MEQEQFLKTVALRLAEIRQEKGISQEELANRAGLHAVAITYIETGKRIPRLDTLYKLAKGLDAPITSFFGDDQSS